LNKGKVFTEVTDEGREFQTVGAARLKALSAGIVLEEGTASRFMMRVAIKIMLESETAFTMCTTGVTAHCRDYDATD